MQTEDDPTYLHPGWRPGDEMARNGVATVTDKIPLTRRPIRVLLVGAGRIALVHALTLSRFNGVVLCGVVDRHPRATGFLRGVGLSLKTFPTLDEALTQTNPDATVIATPPATHLSLTRACVQSRIAVLIEKPLAVNQKQLDDYEQLEKEFPDCLVQAGYVMPRNPQVSLLIDKLRSGCLGKVRGFVGVTLLSFIQKPKTKRWEVNKSISGGGALINAGGHVLSMIHAAFGEPRAIEARTLKLYSSEVEDSIALSFEYPEFWGQHYCSWSINGYPRQENKLIIRTELGQLILTASVAVFVSNDGDVDINHQLDFDVGFNLAPDYAGGGFSNELNDLKESVLTGRPAPMNLSKAIKLERLLFKAYEVARETKSFRVEDGPSVTFSTSGEPRLRDTLPGVTRLKPVRRVLDLRDLPAEALTAHFGSADGKNDWSEYLFTPNQLAGLPAQLLAEKRVRVTIPDFLNQSRLLSTARYGEALKPMGVWGFGMAVRAALPMLIKARAGYFWVAAAGLVGAALQAVPPEFQGSLFLHVYLTDLALSLRRLDILKRILASCRRICPRARLGFHTNMAAEAMHALPLMRESVDEVSVLTSPRAPGTSKLFAGMRRADGKGTLGITAEVGLAPDVVHKVAFDAPESWAHGADALLIGPAADPVTADQRCRQLEQEWSKVFPGCSPPSSAL